MNGTVRPMGHVEHDDLALFAMQLLTREETAGMTAHIAGCPECRRVLATVQAELAIYAHTVDLHSPPALTRERLMKQVAREKKAAAPVERERERERERVTISDPVRTSGISAVHAAVVVEEPAEDRYISGRRGLGSGAYLSEEHPPKRGAFAAIFPWLGWICAAGLAVAGGKIYHERDALRQASTEQISRLDHLRADGAAARQVLDALTDASAQRINLTTKAQTSLLPQGRVIYEAEKGTLIFFGTNLEALQPEKTYELWLIPAADGDAPIAVGTFRPDDRGNASLILPPLPKGVEAKAFGVTVEQEGGATSPTLPIVLVGE